MQFVKLDRLKSAKSFSAIIFLFQKLYQVKNNHKSFVTDLVFAPPESASDYREFTLLSISTDHDIRIHENTASGRF